MAYEFVDFIKPQGDSKFYLLEDKFIKGGFHIVDTKAELDTLNPTILKKGMLVAVNEEDGTLYECTDLVISVDEFGDPLVSSTFAPLNLGIDNTAPSGTAYARPKKTVNFSYVSPGAQVNIPVNMACQSFILTQLKVTTGRKVKIRIFTSAAKTDPLVFEFNSSKKSYMDGSTYLKNNSRFQYKKCFVFVNKEPNPTARRIFIIECQSLEDSMYYTSKNLSSSQVSIELTYIPLET